MMEGGYVVDGWKPHQSRGYVIQFSECVSLEMLSAALSSRCNFEYEREEEGRISPYKVKMLEQQD